LPPLLLLLLLLLLLVNGGHVRTLGLSRCFHEVISRFLRSLANRACMSCEIEKFKFQAEKNASYSSRRAEASSGIITFFSLS